MSVGTKERKRGNTSSNGSQDAINEPVADSKESVDQTFKKARLAIVNTFKWMEHIQTKSGGLLGYFKNASFERTPPEVYKTYAFQANRARNRNPDIPLHDNTRIRLKIENESDNNYINASNVACPPCDRKWIVAQHPMEPYFSDFWKMVFYEEIDVIFAIFSPDEMLPTYFPTETGKFFNHGDFFVHCWKMSPATGKYQAARYTIEVLPHGCSNARYTTILHYPHWPKDHVAPDAKVVLKGIQGLQPIDKVTKGKCLVHSAEGINRAMCFVLVDFFVELMFRNNTVDVPELITMLRGQRGGAFNNRIYCVYALYVAIGYVKIRLEKFRNEPTLRSGIESLQNSLKKEFSTIIPKEPNISSKVKISTDVTVD